MGRRKKLSLLHCLAIQLLSRSTHFSTTHLTELLLPTVQGGDATTLYQRIRRLQEQSRKEACSRLPEPGTFLIHGVDIGYRFHRDRLAVIAELNSGWVWAKVYRDVRPVNMINCLDAAIDQVRRCLAMPPIKRIILTCFDSPLRTSYRDGDRVSGKVKAALYGTVIRDPYDDVVAGLRQGIKERYPLIDIQPLLLPNTFREAEPLTLPGECIVRSEWADWDRLTKEEWEWENRPELNRCIKKFLSVYNHQSREGLPWTIEPVAPIDRLRATLLPDVDRKPGKKRGGVLKKADLTKKIQTATGLTLKESAGVREDVFELIKKTLESGESLKLSGFGTFEIRSKKSRRGCNPQSGETIEIASRRVLSFKSSVRLRQAINR